MSYPILEQVAKSARHTSFFLCCGRADAVPIIFVHGWPELSISWRHQLPLFGNLGFRAIAPDMRGYGRSSVYARHEDYALEPIVADMIALLDALGAEKAIWVGHDWGAPAVWSIAQHHPERCHGVANLCVPYMPEGFAPEIIVKLADRTLYPEADHPAAQWDYMYFYRENFAEACAGFERNVRATVKLLFRAGNPAAAGLPAPTAGVRARGGWFGPGQGAPDLPRDVNVLSEEDENRYTEALTRNGFFGPDSWYMNGPANMAYAARAPSPRLTLPTLFLHGAYDSTCMTVGTRLPEPMRAACANLTERVIASGHWMAQEQPVAVNAALTQWIVQQMPALWPAPASA
jgi:pimeloyl-ACP methyl ester carboxylesterase